MATIVRRPSKNGQTSYRAQVRRKGAPPLSATFTKLSDAKKWVQITEAAILEGRHFTTTEAKRHTLTDLVERYLVEVMPQKRPRTSYTQIRHLYWWRAQLGPHALAAITPVTIAECRNQLAQNHAPATVVRYLSTLRSGDWTPRSSSPTPPASDLTTCATPGSTPYRKPLSQISVFTTCATPSPHTSR